MAAVTGGRKGEEGGRGAEGGGRGRKERGHPVVAVGVNCSDPDLVEVCQCCWNSITDHHCNSGLIEEELESLCVCVCMCVCVHCGLPQQWRGLEQRAEVSHTLP